MTGRPRLGLVAASATLLASAPIATIFESWTWLIDCILAVGLIAGAAVLARTVRFPVWAQTLSMVVALLLALTWMFPSGHEIIIPTPATFRHFADLLVQAGQETQAYSVPVPDRRGMLLLAVAGIGAVAIVVDLLVVVARRPALAGLPMLAIYSVPVAIYVDSVPITPFLVGAAGFLWLLVADNIDRVRRFGRRFTGDGRDVGTWEPSPLAAAGRRLGLVGLAAAVLVPLLVPAMAGGLLADLTQGGSGSGSGGLGQGNGRINLRATLQGRLTQGSTVALIHLTTNEPDPFYLRFGTADQLTEDGFGNQAPNGPSVSQELPLNRLDSVPRPGTAQQYRASVQITDDLRQNYAPIYLDTFRVNDLGRGWSYDPNQQVLFSNRTTTRGKTYSFDYLRYKYDPEDLRSARPLPPDDAIQRAYTNAPRDATVEDKVADLVRGKTTVYDKVRALYDFFSAEHGFTYSLATQSTENASDIAAFLRSRSGYCQQYAAALAWMVRAAGIPARVAFGFTRGTTSDNVTYEITNRNAHAWTEVYLQGFGWLPFDATPASGVPGHARPAWAPDPDEPTPTASASTGSNRRNPTASSSAGAAQRPERPSNDTRSTSAPGDDTTGISATTLAIVAGIAAVVALLMVPALRRTMLRRRRHAATRTPTGVPIGGADPPDRDIVVTTASVRARADAHAAWDELVDTMTDLGIRVDPTETPRVTARRLTEQARLPGEPAEALILLSKAEERARYARTPLVGAELVPALQQVRRGLAHSVTRRTRVVSVLLPPSVLRRWRYALADASARMLARAVGFRDRLVRFSPRRLLPGRSR